MTSHPLAGFVKAELAYRADPWNPGLRDHLDVWSKLRLGRRRRGHSRDVAVAGARASERLPAPTRHETPAPLAVVRPFPRAPRRPDAA